MTNTLKQLFPDQTSAGNAVAALRKCGLSADCETAPNGVLVEVGVPFGTARTASQVMARFNPIGSPEIGATKDARPTSTCAITPLLRPVVALADRGGTVDSAIARASRPRILAGIGVASARRVDPRIAAASASPVRPTARPAPAPQPAEPVAIAPVLEPVPVSPPVEPVMAPPPVEDTPVPPAEEPVAAAPPAEAPIIPPPEEALIVPPPAAKSRKASRARPKAE